jgi:hypothetical protein
MKHLKSYKVFESLDFNKLENTDISDDIKYILMDAQDLGYTIDTKLSTNYKTTRDDGKVDYHYLEVRFSKKYKSVVEFESNELKEIDDRLINYFGDHLIATYYNDLVKDSTYSDGSRSYFRLSPNPDPNGSPGHKFPENLTTKGLSMRYIVDKDFN